MSLIRPNRVLNLGRTFGGCTFLIPKIDCIVPCLVVSYFLPVVCGTTNRLFCLLAPVRDFVIQYWDSVMQVILSMLKFCRTILCWYLIELP